MTFVVGVDSGGTFTDTVVVDEKGRFTIGKAPSTPGDFSLGVLASLRDAASRVGIGLETLLGNTGSFMLGTTVGLNALLSGKGIKTGLITTKGFEDILLLEQTQKVAGLTEREIIHAVKLDRPHPIVPRRLIKGVTERVDYKGRVIVSLNSDETRQAIQDLVKDGVQAVAVSFLWSFLNPKHEHEVRALIREMAPGIFVTISSELVPLIGEYQRTVTTAMNCLLGPIIFDYFRTLKERLTDEGLRCPLRMMQSMGGVMPVEEASAKAVMTLGSGPVGGVTGAKFLGDTMGLGNIICTDVGGTSFDVGLLVDGEVQYAAEPVVGKYHIALPVVETRSIGSGGGSIAWLEPETGVLRVGPQGAGADPGPACYDKGGLEPTVTDAGVVLGYLNPDYFLGGKMTLKRERAVTAIKTKVADPLGMDVVHAATGIYRICASQMADLIRKMTVERGYDCRDFVLLSYGGAGPQYAALFMQEIEVGKVVVPALAAAFSAFGLAASDIVHFYSRSYPMMAPGDAGRLNLIYRDLEKKALEELARECVPEQEIVLMRSVDMRYKRQWHEVSVSMPQGELEEQDIEDGARRFTARYGELYGRGAGFEKAGIEMTTYAVKAIGKMARPSLVKQGMGSRNAAHALKTRRPAYFEAFRDMVDTAVYHGETLQPGNVISGPAIIEALTTTVVIQPGQGAVVDEYLNIILHAQDGQERRE